MPPQWVICTAPWFVTDAYVSEDELETHGSFFFFFSFLWQRLFQPVNTIIPNENRWSKILRVKKKKRKKKGSRRCSTVYKISNEMQLKTDKNPKWQNNDMAEIYIGFRGSISLSHGGEVAGWLQLPCGCCCNVNSGSNTAVTGGRAWWEPAPDRHDQTQHN